MKFFLFVLFMFIVPINFALGSKNVEGYGVYEPTKEMDAFRDKITGLTRGWHGANLLKWEQQIDQLAKENPGFQMLKCHVNDCDCHKQGTKSTEKSSIEKQLKKSIAPSCIYSLNCYTYAGVVALLEQYPADKDEAVAIWNRLESIYDLPRKQVECLEDAHIIGYEGGHWGVYRGNGIVESTGGLLPVLFRHKIFQVPINYSNKVHGIQIDIESLISKQK